MLIRSSARGLDAAALRPGRDLVFEIEEAQGVDLPPGVLASDHLEVEERRRADELAAEALGRWRELYDDRLTVAGVCLPFVRELELYSYVFVPTVRDALGLGRALDAYGPRTLLRFDRDPHVDTLVAAVAARHGVSVQTAADAEAARPWQPPWQAYTPPMPWLRRLRRRLIGVLLWFGVPSRLRAESIVFDSYWPMMPLLDRMLADDAWRPAVTLSSPPSGPARSLAAARRGGWLGRPGLLTRGRARRATRNALAPAVPPPRLVVEGCELGPCLHAKSLELLRSRVADDVASAETTRRALASKRVNWVVTRSDLEPSSRLLVAHAQEVGIPTLVVQHGAYFLPSLVADLGLADELAIWSEAVAPRAGALWHRAPRIIGYPLPHDPPLTRTYRGGGAPRIVVIPQPWHPSTAVLDARVVMQHYTAAIEGILARFSGAQVTLRPHPADDPAPVGLLRERFPEVAIEAQREVLDLLSDCDLCIGAPSAATLQAALVGTPVVVLNVTGYEWRWPLGGTTSVPVARSAAELSAWLDRWALAGSLPGGDDLLSALGVDGGDATERLLEVLYGRAPSPTHALS